MAIIDASTVIYTETALKRLTVPQLKLICKERRIVGYSKLAKDNLVQKLLGSQAASKTGSVIATSPLTPIVQDTGVRPVLPLADSDYRSNRSGSAADATTFPAGPSHEPTLVVQTTEGISAGNPGSKEIHRNDASSHETLTNMSNSSDSGWLKRSSATTQELPEPKKARLDPPRQPSSALCSKSISSTSAALGPKTVETTNTVATETPALSSSVYNMSKSNAKRKFKPLVPSSGRTFNAKAKSQFEPTALIQNLDDGLSGDLRHLDFASSEPVSLATIHIPPSMAQRKHIPTLSLILSAISYDDLKTCALVSRAFRYAGEEVYNFYLCTFHQSNVLSSISISVSSIVKKISRKKAARDPLSLFK